VVAEVKLERKKEKFILRYSWKNTEKLISQGLLLQQLAAADMLAWIPWAARG
jgi:hypothetical protein